MWACLVRDLMTLSLENEGAQELKADKKVGLCRFSVDSRGFVSMDEDAHVWKRSILYKGYYMVYCQSSVRELRKFRNPSACDLSRKSPISSSTKCL